MSARPSDSNELRIGITVGLRQPGEGLAESPLSQAAVFLSMTLARLHRVASVCLVNTTGIELLHDPRTVPEGVRLARFEDIKNDLDIVIEVGGQLGPQETDYMKRNNSRIVSFAHGPEYTLALQSVLFGNGAGGSLFINRRYDALWLTPAIANLSESFFTTLRRLPAQVAPFVWDSVFVEAANAGRPEKGRYTARPGPRRLTVAEPNTDVSRYCFYPVLIAEEAYRAAPELVSFLHVTHAERLATGSPTFVALMGLLDIVRHHKAAFIPGMPHLECLSQLTDVVIAHQLQVSIEYRHLEACWLGYPLVHNADACPDLGYYYPGNDVDEGARQLLHVLREHDGQHGAYLHRQRKRMERFQTYDAKVLREYTRLIDALMAQPLA